MSLAIDQIYRFSVICGVEIVNTFGMAILSTAFLLFLTSVHTYSASNSEIDIWELETRGEQLAALGRTTSSNCDNHLLARLQLG
jgi:hypothetical protein